jgi:hypothetical protein
LQARVFEAVGLVDDEDPEHEGAEATAETSVEAATPETSVEEVAEVEETSAED